MSARPLRRRAVSEAELMAALANGNLSALGELYDRHAEAVRRFALRATGRPDEAEDITHDTFLELVPAAARYEPSRPVRAFAIGIAGKLVLRARRRTAVTARILGSLRATLRRKDSRTPEDAAATDEQLRRYRRALERLTTAKRLVVLMADVEGMSGPDIAAALDIPVGTVWTRLHHARAELRAAMDRGGLR